MATIDLGRIKFKWQGAYNGATAYVVDDVVESGGSAYVCIAATTGNTPPNATYWELMASKGTDTSVLTTQGDVLYHNGTSLARLGAGTSGQALITGGTGANPSWGDVSGGLLQVVNATDSTQRNSTSTSFVTASNTLSVNITPASTSSKIFIICGFSVYTNGAGHCKYTIYRDSTNLGDATHGMFAAYENDDTAKSHTLTYLDSPNTTSQITYQLYIKGFSGIINHYLNYSGATSSITAFEIGV